MYKIDPQYQKLNYWLVSVLTNLSIFENKIYNQILPYFEKIISKYQTGFRKGCNPKTSLVALEPN